MARSISTGSALLALLVMAASCSVALDYPPGALTTGSSSSSSSTTGVGASGGGGGCASADQCEDDGDVCTASACEDGSCRELPIDGAPETQTQFDCKSEACIQGVAYPVDDASDPPVDGEDCTADSCIEGTGQNPALPNGTSCEDGHCLAGECVACVGDVHCPAPSEWSECEAPHCDGGVCSKSTAPVLSQVPGDCMVVVCDGTGQAVPIDDDDDLLDDNSLCTIETCVGGELQTAADNDGEPCVLGGTTTCNNGVCEGCTVPSDCPPAGDCFGWNCVSGTCLRTVAAEGTPLPLPKQVSGDCQELVCDASGAAVLQSDDLDTPPFSQCATSSCDGGTLLVEPAPFDKSCDDGGNHCDGSGNCVECTDDSQCDAPPCHHSACVAGSCETPVALDDGTPVPGQTPGDCHRLECQSGNVVKVVWDSDVPDDDNPCTWQICAGGVALTTVKPEGTPCNDDGTAVCNGDPDAPQCGCAEGDCPEGFTCVDQICQCVPATCAELGLTCGASIVDGCGGALQCDNFVTDAAPAGDESDVDCGGDTNRCARRCDDGDECTKASDCQSGHCVDGVCCESACADLCLACDLPGNLGDCNIVAHGLDPHGDCPGGSCNGFGSCALDDGEPCASFYDCLSGWCQQGVCCASECSGDCESCNPGGSCQLLPPGEEGMCDPGELCGDTGACLNEDGQFCGNDGDVCFSGNCVDGVCCADSACPTCQDCNIDFGSCVDIPLGETDAGCDSGRACDGAGECKGELGTPCMAANMGMECLSGICVDEVCCNNSCGGDSDTDCVECDSPINPGVCMTTSNGMVCATGQCCDGACIGTTCGSTLGPQPVEFAN